MLLKAHLHRRRIIDAAETWSLSTAWSIPCLDFDVLHFSSTWCHKHQQWIQKPNWSPRCIYKAAGCSPQDINHLETRRVVPSLITGPLTQYLHWGDTKMKTVGFPIVSFGCVDLCDLPEDGKLVCVIWKTIVRSWTHTMKLFYMCRYPVGIQQQKTQKKVQLLKRSQVCQWANSPQKSSILHNYKCTFTIQRLGEGKESSTPQVLGMEELFYIATQEAEDNRGQAQLWWVTDQEWT